MAATKLLISDADGTLVDTASLIRHGHYESASEFLRKQGIRFEDVPTYEEYVRFLNLHVGGSTRQTLERTIKALYEYRTHHIEKLDYDAVNDSLDIIQDRIAPRYVKQFSGLSRLLYRLANEDINLAVVTSGSPHHVVRNFGIALEKDLGDYSTLYEDKTVEDRTRLEMFTERLIKVFDLPGLVFITCDDVKERTKPDPYGIDLALRHFGADSGESVMLGDHTYDMKSGINAGIKRIFGITHGFEDREVLSQAGATEVVSSLDELMSELLKTPEY